MASTPHHSDAGCWQIEWVFKRLKSLLPMGHLKKTDPQGAKTWLQGKLLVTALIEKLIAIGERFSNGAISTCICWNASHRTAFARYRDPVRIAHSALNGEKQRCFVWYWYAAGS